MLLCLFCLSLLWIYWVFVWLLVLLFCGYCWMCGFRLVFCSFSLVVSGCGLKCMIWLWWMFWFWIFCGCNFGNSCFLMVRLLYVICLFWVERFIGDIGVFCLWRILWYMGWWKSLCWLVGWWLGLLVGFFCCLVYISDWLWDLL